MDRNFTNEKRIDDLEADFESYIRWHRRSGIIVADSNIRLSYSIGGFLDLSGLISRLDITDIGYRAIILGAGRANWRAELRMPLIQNAIALKYVVQLMRSRSEFRSPMVALWRKRYIVAANCKCAARIAAIGRRDSTVSSTLETLAEIDNPRN